ncbi:MAG: guanylate kinase [Gammaproteobacteria bacterium]|nr:guanylate kinase [Gammaproteobacteria bacterium]
MSNTPGALYILSAPSGAGKTSLVKALLAQDVRVCVSVSHTTRNMRDGEENGIDYNFVSQHDFAQLVEQQQMLEYATVFGNSYGTSRKWVEASLAQGKDVILEIDWQGRDQVLSIFPHAIAVTILPPSQQALQQRLQGRGTDSSEIIATRMAEAHSEISHYSGSHFLVINDDFSEALADLQCIFSCRRLKTPQQAQKHHQLLADLLSTGG